MDIWIFGAGGHATSVFEVARAAGYTPRGFIDPFAPEETLHGMPVHADIPGAPDAQFAAVVAIGDNTVREKVVTKSIAAHPNMMLPALVHPSAVVAQNATIGRGTVVFQTAVIGSACQVGAFCVINTTASLDHECTVENYASIAPRGTLGGRVYVGPHAFLGIASTVLQNRRIGPGVVVGGASLVTRDLNTPGGYWGVPASLRKSAEDMRGFLAS